MKLSLDELEQLVNVSPEACQEMIRLLMVRERKSEEIRRKDRERKRNSKQIPTENNGPPPSSFSPTPPHITTPSNTDNKQNARARGERLPEGFEPSSVDVAVIKNELREFASDWRLSAETEKFRDHWRASSGANAAKRNWGAAWRNWMRNAAERSGSPNGHAPPMRENGALAAVRKQLREIEERDDRKPTFDFDQS